jgi:XTP/dITP diphosphohydrolase
VEATPLLVATRNPGKAREFAAMLGKVVGLGDLPDDDGFEPDETGRTFRDNAVLKAQAYATRHRRRTLADDSGLVVDALDGQPGVHSARFARRNGVGGNDPTTRDADNNSYLLRRLRAVPDEQRTARFVCVLVLCDADGRVLVTAEGSVEGRILREPRGTNGFGYDPLFEHAASSRTTAEMTPDEKHAVSHRGEALRRLQSLLARHDALAH